MSSWKWWWKSLLGLGRCLSGKGAWCTNIRAWLQPQHPHKKLGTYYLVNGEADTGRSSLSGEPQIPKWGITSRMSDSRGTPKVDLCAIHSCTHMCMRTHAVLLCTFMYTHVRVHPCSTTVRIHVHTCACAPMQHDYAHSFMYTHVHAYPCSTTMHTHTYESVLESYTKAPMVEMESTPSTVSQDKLSRIT